MELGDGSIIHKIGLTHSPRSLDRMMEILRSFFHEYCYIPICELRRDKSTPIPRLLEKHLHQLLRDWQFVPDRKTDGYKEMFYGLDEEVLLDYIDNLDYRELLIGKTSMLSKDYDAIKEAIAQQPTPDKPESTDERLF